MHFNSKTQEDAEKDAFLVDLELLEPYKGNNSTKHLYKCKVCGNIELKLPGGVHDGRRCRKCSNKVRASKISMSSGEGLELAEKTASSHGGLFPEGQEWKGTQKKYKWICNIHGEFTMKFANATSTKQWCNPCSDLNSHEKNEEDRKGMIGKRFGMLTVLNYELRNEALPAAYYECKCDCGEVNWVFVGNLKRGNHSTSCGNHGNLSETELRGRIQKEFPDTIKAKRGFFKCFNSLMELDIYIPSLKVAIEYDGFVHFKPVFGGKEGFEKVKIRDKLKNKYCKDLGIYLIRVSDYAYQLNREQVAKTVIKRIKDYANGCNLLVS